MNRLDILEVSLRRVAETADCMDLLTIRDMTENGAVRYICGILSGFGLVMSHHINIHVKISNLEAVMPEWLGFSLQYEAVSTYIN